MYSVVLLTLGAHVHEDYSNQFVCLFRIYRGLHNKMNLPADFSLKAEDFQLRDFFETLSFKSYMHL